MAVAVLAHPSPEGIPHVPIAGLTDNGHEPDSFLLSGREVSAYGLNWAKAPGGGPVLAGPQRRWPGCAEMTPRPREHGPCA